MMDSCRPLRSVAGHRYVDEGPGDSHGTVILLHGMIGGTANWDETVSVLAGEGYRAVVPKLPVFESGVGGSSVSELAKHVASLVGELGIDRGIFAGNSLGGHVATMFALDNPERVAGLVLTGASGVHELDMGATALRRNDRRYLRERAEMTFYDPAHVTDRLLDEVIEAINDRTCAQSVIRLARSVKREVVTQRLGEIRAPTLIVWGRQDRITPPDVAETLAHRIPDAALRWIDRCGHAPMMERPAEFHRLLLEFLGSLVEPEVLSDERRRASS